MIKSIVVHKKNNMGSRYLQSMIMMFSFLESATLFSRKIVHIAGLAVLMLFFFFSESYGNSLPQGKSSVGTTPVQEKELQTNTTPLISSLENPPNISKFTSSPFGRKAPKPEVDQFLVTQIRKANKVKDASPSMALSDRSDGSFSRERKEINNEAMVNHSDIPTLTETSLANVDRQKATEVDVTYKVDEVSHVRLAINSQDENSPLYTPLKKEEGVNAAGVYMGVDVTPSTTVYVGGEVRNNETVKENSPESSSAGAALSVAFEF